MLQPKVTYEVIMHTQTKKHIYSPYPRAKVTYEVIMQIQTKKHIYSYKIAAHLHLSIVTWQIIFKGIPLVETISSILHHMMCYFGFTNH